MMWRMLGAEHPMLAHRADSRGMLARGQSADAIEGVTAFLEKRPAHFPDRVSDGLPDILPGWQRARVLLARSRAVARARSGRSRCAAPAARGTPIPSHRRTQGSYTGRKPSSCGIVTIR